MRILILAIIIFNYIHFIFTIFPPGGNTKESAISEESPTILKDLIVACFDSPFEGTKSAAAYALGHLAVGTCVRCPCPCLSASVCVYVCVSVVRVCLCECVCM